MLLKTGYIGLSLLMAIILIIIGFKAIDKDDKKKKTALVLGLFFWQTYIYFVASSGILLDYNFPPKFVLFLIFPAFLFTGIFLFINRNKDWIQRIPRHWLIYYQTFRIGIETLFVYSVAAGILHYHVTIEGYNYDMVFAITAPIIAYLVFQKKTLSKKYIVWWNYLGLLVIASIIFVFLSTTYMPQLYGSDTMLLPQDFGQYPYMLVPGFLMPSAVFIHILSLLQHVKDNNTNSYNN